MANLESARTGRIWQGIGVFFLLWAAGDGVAASIWRPGWAVWVNLITASCGLIILAKGTREAWRAREHRRIMEGHRQRIEQLYRKLEGLW